MYYNNKKTKKKYMSDDIETELEWVNDLPWQKKIWYNKLNIRIRIAYTYYIYHNYSISELAKINRISEKTIVEWILTAAYIIDGKYIKLDDFGFIEPRFMTNIIKRFPEVKNTPKCRDCVWADLKTGHRLCFRDCDHGSYYQRRRSV
ncbi:MAG: hypothetical protein K6F27_13780 [Ruminococcus sp.]|nr:hypothetical protein [Ruminococcus sp.]